MGDRFRLFSLSCFRFITVSCKSLLCIYFVLYYILNFIGLYLGTVKIQRWCDLQGNINLSEKRNLLNIKTFHVGTRRFQPIHKKTKLFILVITGAVHNMI